ncbi:methyltransferase domain-containing protein, partial [Jiangella aurantiaca]
TTSTDSASGVGNGLHADTGTWTFAGDVPRVFGDHVRHSVPLYDIGHDLVCDLATSFLGRDGRGVGYELGCATGELLHRLATHSPVHAAARWIGVDREEGMTTAARERCAGLGNVELVHGDLTTLDYEACDFVVAYLTLHFIPIDQRVPVIRRLHDALRPGGALFLFEKVLAANAQLEDLFTTLHYRWKRGAGLSPEEILNKKDSLVGILKPTTSDDNVAMLHAGGFTTTATALKHLCFEGFVAVK